MKKLWICAGQNKMHLCWLLTGLAIDGNNSEDKERYIQLVKKTGNVKALDEELYSKCAVL